MLKALGIIIRYFPVIVVLVQSIEALSDDEVTGAEKKLLFMSALRDILANFGVIVNNTTERFISDVVDAFVSLMNLLGKMHPRDEAVGDATPDEIRDAAVRVMGRTMSSDEVNEKLGALQPTIENIGN